MLHIIFQMALTHSDKLETQQSLTIQTVQGDTLTPYCRSGHFCSKTVASYLYVYTWRAQDITIKASNVLALLINTNEGGVGYSWVQVEGV